MSTATVSQDAPVTKQPMSVEQKEAATLRRDATLLAKYGDSEKAAELIAQADKLFPASAKQGKRVNPLTVLSADEQKALKDYFRTSKGFERLAQVVSAKKLSDILTEISA